MTSLTHETQNMALFCDFENVALGVEDARYAPFDIRLILEKLLVKGSIVVKKAYCDWERYKSFKAAMHQASFEMIEIPHVRQSGKNSADIRLVVDALDLCYTKSHVDTFVIISGDSDFSPLVSKLRENNKTVIGIGVKSSTSDLLIANCDEFIYYDDLVRDQARPKARARKSSPKAPAKPTERSAENGTRNGAKTTERATEKTAEKGSEKSTDKTTDKTRETSADTPANSAAKATGGKASASAGRGERGTRRTGTTKAGSGEPVPSPDDGAAASPAMPVESPAAAPAASASQPALLSEPVAAPPVEAPASPPEPDDDERLQAALDLVLDTYEALLAERGAEDKIWGSMIKQALKRRNPGFSESYYGFRSFNGLLEEAQARKLIELELDEKSGGYKVRAA